MGGSPVNPRARCACHFQECATGVAPVSPRARCGCHFQECDKGVPPRESTRKMILPNESNSAIILKGERLKPQRRVWFAANEYSGGKFILANITRVRAPPISALTLCTASASIRLEASYQSLEFEVRRTRISLLFVFGAPAVVLRNRLVKPLK